MTKGISEYLVAWLRERVSEAGAKGIVVGISGGIDSAVVSAIAKKAYPDNSLGLILPCISQPNDVEDAVELCNTIGMRYHIVPLEHCYESFMNLMNEYPESAISSDREKLTNANVKPRMRMMSLYYMAGLLNYLVVGTSNKCEIAVGYATKWGDNAVDIQLLGDLYKSEIYALARELGVPQSIIDKAPSAGLWEGQTDESEMGFTYGALEKYLQTGEGEAAVIEKIQYMNKVSEHKRRTPLIANLDGLRS